ncbi:MAG: ABC transporter permease [Muribaculaceae bacterium]|jgi:putative ABC transport system permease protein|nr:ABC transporter permease [Muribaculaceae bacterium]
MKLLKETIYNLRRQPVISMVTIIGTALSIFLVMVVVMLHQVQVIPFSPESNRDRFQHYSWISFGNTEWGDPTESNSNGPMAFKVVKEFFYQLEEPEAVTAYVCQPMVKSVSLPKQKPFSADVRETDANYFKVFDLKFITGAPYTQADFESGLPKAVIDENVATRLYGTTDAVGKEFLLNGGTYKVTGVVRPVSTIAENAYAHLWINTTSTGGPEGNWSTIGGMYSVTLLAKDSGKESMEALHDEVERRLVEYNKEIGTAGWMIINRNRPYTQEKEAAGGGANVEPDEKGARKVRWITFAILLIVPAINLSSMTHSRLRRRVSEIAVRRAFGQTRMTTVISVINENLIVTIIAGLIGLLMSVVLAYVFGDMLFAKGYSFTLSRPDTDMSMLLSWSTFGWALLFCFILNILSSGIPAIQASRQPLVNSLRGGGNNH